MRGQHGQLTPTSLEQLCMHVSGVTCNLHFWQNVRGLLRTTPVNTGLERTPYESQHGKLILERRILPPLRPGFELATFDHESGALPTSCSGSLYPVVACTMTGESKEELEKTTAVCE